MPLLTTIPTSTRVPIIAVTLISNTSNQVEDITPPHTHSRICLARPGSLRAGVGHAGADSVMQERPDAAELLEAVAEYLVRGSSDPRSQASSASRCSSPPTSARSSPARSEPETRPTGMTWTCSTIYWDRRATTLTRPLWSSPAGSVGRAPTTGSMRSLPGSREHVRRKLDIARPGYADGESRRSEPRVRR